MEMTTYEILEVLRGRNDDRTTHDWLRQILQLADFVKFAKLHPLPDENDLSLSNAYSFVSQTKPEEAPAPVNTPETAAEGETGDSKPGEGGEK